MKNKIYYLIGLVFSTIIIASCSVKRNTEISLKIENNSIKGDYSNLYKFFEKGVSSQLMQAPLIYTIYNNSDYDIAIPIDTARLAFFESNSLDFYFPDKLEKNNIFNKQRYQPAIFIRDKQNDLLSPGGGLDFLCENYYEKLPDFNTLFKTNLFIIKKNSYIRFSRNISLPILLSKANEECYDSLIYMDLLKNQTFSLQLYLKVNREEIKKYLPKEKLDSLQKNNIKIFNGELKNNKVPLLIE